MWKFVIFAIFNVLTVQGLECGIHINKNEQLIGVLNQCLKSNKTMEDLYDMTSTSSESESSNSSEETTIDNKMAIPMRHRRFVTLQNDQDDDDNGTIIIDNSEGNNGNRSTDNEHCTVQCIFQNLNMTDMNGFPDHTRILESLVKPSTGREFKDFIQDTIDECFREMESLTALESCSFSTKLISCLVDKGRENCADWPVGELPFPTQ